MGDKYMALPVLFRFLENPSYLDRKQLGYHWKQEYKFDERWKEFKSQYNTFKPVYYIEDESSYYVHMTIPSNKRGNTYDVVIHFLTNSNTVMNDFSLRNYNIQIFSNNPVFGFYFGYANYSAGIIIPFLAHKLGDEILSTPAKKHNPRNAIGYDHSFYIAGMALMDSARLMNKTYIKEHAKPFNEKELLANVRLLKEVMEDYQDNKDRSGNKKTFNRDKSILDKTGELIQDAKSKVGEIIDRTFTTPGSNVKRPKKFVGGDKAVIKDVTRKSATRSTVIKKATSGIKRATVKKPKRKI